MVDPLHRLPEVERLVGLKRSRIQQLEAAGKFPRRVQISDRAVAWRESELIAWIESRRPVPRVVQPKAAS